MSLAVTARRFAKSQREPVHLRHTQRIDQVNSETTEIDVRGSRLRTLLLEVKEQGEVKQPYDSIHCENGPCLSERFVMKSPDNRETVSQHQCVVGSCSPQGFRYV